jgi:hypothetical protein
LVISSSNVFFGKFDRINLFSINSGIIGNLHEKTHELNSSTKWKSKLTFLHKEHCLCKIVYQRNYYRESETLLVKDYIECKLVPYNHLNLSQIGESVKWLEDLLVFVLDLPLKN